MEPRYLFQRQWWILCSGMLAIVVLMGGAWGLCAPAARASVLAQEPTATLPPRHTPTAEPVTPTPATPTATPTPTPTLGPPTPTSPPGTEEPPPSEPSEPTATPTYVLLPNSGQRQGGALASEGMIVGALLLAGAVILGAYVARKGMGH